MKPYRFDPEKLRPIEYLNEVDPRNTYFLRNDPKKGISIPISLQDHHNDILTYDLHKGVPTNISTHFETTKNLYLYSWIIYRFYPVAENHAYTCLEFALRERFAKQLAKEEPKRYSKMEPTLYPLMKYAVKHKHIKNEDFKIWHAAINTRARIRHQREKFQELIDKNLDSITFNEEDFTITEEDKNWDFVAMLMETIPKARNNYSHGSSDLHNYALNGIRIVSEIINAIYNNPDKNSNSGVINE